MSNILILGKGAFGSAIGHCLKSKHNLSFYTRSDYGIEIKHKIDNVFFSLQEVFENNVYDVIVNALPSKEIESIFSEISQYITKETIVINCSKGLCNKGSWDQLIKGINNHFIYTSLNGPSFASEMLNDSKTIVNLFCDNELIFKQVSDLFNHEIIKFQYIEKQYHLSELISSLKNAVAIGMGLVHSLTNSVNTINWMYTIALQEVNKIVEYLFKTKPDMVQLFGIGDYTMCCFDKQSRNFSFGFNNLKSDSNTTIEGIRTINIINEKCKNLQLNFFYNLGLILEQKIKSTDFVNYVFKQII